MPFVEKKTKRLLRSCLFKNRDPSTIPISNQLAVGWVSKFISALAHGYYLAGVEMAIKLKSFSLKD